MDKAEALAAAKAMFGGTAWVSINASGWVTVASDPKCRVRIGARSYEEALILAEEKLIDLQKRQALQSFLYCTKEGKDGVK